MKCFPTRKMVPFLLIRTQGISLIPLTRKFMEMILSSTVYETAMAHIPMNALSISVLTEKNTSLSFSDMEDSNCQAAALVMTDSGHMDFEEEDGEVYFEPSSEVTRLDFLVTAMNVLGAENIPEVTSTGFADDADIPQEYKGYVYSAYQLGIVNGVPIGNERYFKPNEPITKAQASVILNNILGYSATVKVNCSDEIPTWASASIDALWELGIYPVSGGLANPAAVLTKEDTAKMLFNMTTLLDE